MSLIIDGIKNKLHQWKIQKQVFEFKALRDYKRKLANNLATYCDGKFVDTWITDGGRSTGVSIGDLCENPSNVIEDIIRDEMHTERDLEVDSIGTWDSGTKRTVSCDGLMMDKDDFYNGARFFVTKRSGTIGTGSVTVSDYDGSSKTLYLSTLLTIAAGDYFYLTRVDCDVDTDSFDDVGNTTDGTRKDWKMARIINEKESTRTLLESLQFESATLLTNSYEDYKLTALEDKGSNDFTFSSPLYDKGRPLVAWGLTSPLDLYDEFKLNYNYDALADKFRSHHFINKYESSDATNLGSSYQTKCLNVNKNYKIARKYEYDCLWINDDDTAAYLMQWLVNWHTAQRVIANYTGNLKDHIRYEKGDQGLINVSDILPTGVNNSSRFMITKKRIIPNKGNWAVNFELTELP